MITIGIFGGTFDPPHVGHLALASAARIQLGLDRLLWMLTPDPPHKLHQTITPIAHRLAMVDLALAGHPEFELSRVELDRPGPHYALDTVRLVQEQNPDSGIVYLMGSDSLRDLPSWHRPSDLLSALRYIGVMRRPDSNYDLPALEEMLPGISAKVRFVDAPPVDISASEIRSLAAAGKPFREFVTGDVYEYIIEYRLYSPPPIM
jgi:nicotinate-nucleotide adenylyltransferase